MQISDYLNKLGWNPQKWTILKEDEWQPLMKVSGYQNNMFDAVKDPEGRKEFGKNARIVEKSWMNKHMAAASVPEQPKEEAPKAPPAVPSAPANTPPVPEVPDAPGKLKSRLQEIADASPNVVIGSVPPPVPKVPEVPQAASENKSDEEMDDNGRDLRESQLKALGWTLDEESRVFVSKKGTEVDVDELVMLSDEDFFSMLSNESKKTEAPKEEPKQEESKPVQIKQWPAHVKTRVANLTATTKWKYIGEDTLEGPGGKKLTYQELDDMENKEFTALLSESQPKPKVDPEKLKQERIDFLVKNGLKLSEDGTKLIAPNTDEVAVSALGIIEEKDWMDLTVRYSAKKVKDMQLAKEDADRLRKELKEQQDRDQAAKDEQAAHEELEGQELSGKTPEEVEAEEAQQRYEDEVNREPEKEETPKKRSESAVDEYFEKQKSVKGKTPESLTGDGSENDTAPKGKFISSKDNKIELTKEEAEVFKNDIASKMTTGDTGGLFDALAHVGFGQLNFSLVPLSNGKFQITVSMVNDDTDLETAQKFLAEVSKFEKLK